MDARQGIQACERLVQDEKVGIIEQRLRNTRALQHALRIRLQRTLRGVRKPHLLQQFISTRPNGLPVESADATVEVEQFARIEIRIVIGNFRHIADTGARLRIRWIAPHHPHGSGGRADEPEQHLDGRCLPRAVRAEKTHDLALPERKRQPGHGLDLSEPPRNILNRQNAHTRQSALLPNVTQNVHDNQRILEREAGTRPPIPTQKREHDSSRRILK